MTKKIYKAICLVAALVLVCSTIVLTAVLYGHFSTQIQAELQVEAAYLARGLELGQESYLQGLTDRTRRITLIAPDGTVTYDNTADPAAMGNHLSRDEVREAAETGRGADRRVSETLAEETYYYALRLEDGAILRLAATQRSVLALLVRVMGPVLAVIAAILLLSVLLARSVARRIVAPINALDLEQPENNQVYEEISPLLGNIARLRRTIDQQLAQARKRQEEFRLITDHMSEGLLVLDSGAQVLSCNGAALRLLGQERVPENAGVLALNRSEAFRAVVERTLAGTRCERYLETGEQTLEIIGNPVRQDGAVTGAVLLVVDVTERAQRERLRREFSANVSHELKTPLTSISGFAELMKTGMVPPADMQDFSQSIYDEARRLMELVEDIIRLSALDETDPPRELEQVELLALVREELRHLEPMAKKRQVTLSVRGEEAVLSGDRQILREIAANLCDNAIKYNRPGGTVEVTVSGGDPVRLTVRDTGIGIPAASRERVFERFYRVDKSHSKEVGGTGLGLSIVKHGVLFHRGRIILDSTEGAGTVITVEFPNPEETGTT